MQVGDGKHTTTDFWPLLAVSPESPLADDMLAAHEAVRAR